MILRPPSLARLARRAILAFAAAFSTSAAAISAGDLDPGFQGGMIEVAYPCAQQCSFEPRAMAVQPDGRIVVAGMQYDAFGPSDPTLRAGANLFVVRRMPGGSADPSFGSAGIVALDRSRWSAAAAVALQPDGKIVVAGSVAGLHYSDPVHAMLVRLDADGRIDASFGSAGVSELDLGLPDLVRVGAVGLQSDGRIVLAFETALALPVAGMEGALRVVRLEPDGQLDSGFALGTGLSSPASVGGSATSGSPVILMAVQPDDRLVVATQVFAGSAFDQAKVLRLTAEGLTDTTFLPHTFAPIDVPTHISGLALQADGAIVAAGSFGAGTIARLLPDGRTDTSFGIAGMVNVQNPIAPQAIAIESDGRIVAAGRGPITPGIPAAQVIGFVRLLPGGTLDASVKGTGSATNNLPGLREPVGIAITPGGNVLVATKNYQAPSDLLVVKYIGDRAYDVFSDAGAFAAQQYRDFLGREGDAGGISYWAGRIARGELSRGQAIEQFLQSPEFQGTVAPVARLYFAYFLRMPDYPGIDFWIHYYRGGQSLQAISDFFAGSAEFQSRYGALDNSAFVTLVYRNVLGRAPDGGGLAFWVNELDTGHRTRGQVMLGFSESPEYVALTFSEVYVTMTYIGMLRRVPDPGGFVYWVDFLDQGHSGLALIDGVLASTEYRGRFLP